MTPKLIPVHLFHSGQVLEDPRDEILLNPRRVDYFRPEPPPTQQPTLFCGTRVGLGSKQFIIVRETLTEIRRLLK